MFQKTTKAVQFSLARKNLKCEEDAYYTKTLCIFGIGSIAKKFFFAFAPFHLILLIHASHRFRFSLDEEKAT